MTKKRRLLSLLLCLWMLLPLFAVFALPASAAGAAEMDASYVVDDLNTMGVDITKYPGDASDDRVEILKVIEFGYKSNRDFSEYGLYLYLYNPSGKTISGDKNCVQLAYELNGGGTTSYLKYRLNILSHSTGSGRENVFWKVKVEGAEAIAPLVNQAARVYKISGVEILRPGNNNATDYAYGCGSFTFTGYHKGCNSNDYSTLRCIADTRDIVKLELHPVTYYAAQSGNGSNYKAYDEVFGVYFSVPDWVVKKYGNLDDETLRGLKAVKGTYREVTTNGILTDQDTLSRLYAASGISSEDVYFRCAQGGNSISGTVYTRVTGNCEPFLSKMDIVSAYVNQFLPENIWKTSNSLDGLGADAFEERYVNSGRGALTRSELKSYTVTDKDIGSVKQYVGFWKSLGNFFLGKDNRKTVFFDMLQRVGSADIQSKSAAEISEAYKVTEADAAGLKSYVTKYGTGSTTYVMHFAVREAVTAKITDAGTLDRDAWRDYFDEVSSIGNSYYFEKTVFEEFDVLELHYANKENKMSVVPVSASPIDVTGGIPAPGQDNPNAIPSDSSVLSSILKILAVIAVILLAILVIRLCGGVSGFFGVIQRGVSNLSRSVKKAFQSRKRDRKKSKKSKTKSKKENQS